MPNKDIKKDIKYINKDFVNFRNSMIEFAKVYFPDSYNDFNELSPGMMFMEMAAYVGDVLSFYTDQNLKESFLHLAEERQNLIYLAQSRGYKYKTTSPAKTVLDVYQLCPSTGINGEEIDFNFALKLEPGMIVSSKSSSNVRFRTTEAVDFSQYGSEDFKATVYEVDNSGNPLMYLLKKQVPVIAGTIKNYTFDFGQASSFTKVKLPDTDVIEILSAVDSDGNNWYEVEYLAQDTILYGVENSSYFSTTDFGESQDAPQIMKLKKVSNRYTTKNDIDGKRIIYFGAGTSAYPDELIVPSKFNNDFNNNLINFDDPSNSFLITRTYGVSPSNTSIEFTYTTGGGLESNVPQGDLVNLIKYNISNNINEYSSVDDKNMYGQVKKSLTVNNSLPAVGGRGEETLEEIRQNSIAYFFSQDRCVTDNDFLAKTLSMPSKYGSIAKAHVKKSKETYGIDIFVLSYDNNKKLVNSSDTIKRNLQTYLSQYRSLNTNVTIKNAYPVNIAVYFSIVTLPKYNKEETILKCIEKLKKYFNIDNWQIGQPIVISEIYSIIENTEGVKTALDVEIKNRYKSNEGYNDNYYHIKAATVDGIVYPSTDPSIFEVKFPDRDIIGKSK